MKEKIKMKKVIVGFLVSAVTIALVKMSIDPNSSKININKTDVKAYSYQKTEQEQKKSVEDKFQKIMDERFMKDKIKFEKERERNKKVKNESFSIRNKNIVFTNDTYFQDLKTEKLTWFKAYEYCSKLELYDSTNWYLPNKDEFMNLFTVTSLNSFSGLNYELNKLFTNIATSTESTIDNNYWTSTTYQRDGLNTSALMAMSSYRHYEVWSKNKKFQFICATKDKVVSKNDKITTYKEVSLKDKVVPKNTKTNTDNKKVLSTLELKIKKCTHEGRGWKFNSKDEVVCKNYRSIR